MDRMQRNPTYDFVAFKCLRASRFDMSIQPMKCSPGSPMSESWVARVERG